MAKKLFFSLWFVFCLLSLEVGAQKAKVKAYALGFYNVENLFDTYDNPDIKDEEFTPTGKKAWTHDKYEQKVANIASVISLMGKDLCTEGISVLGISEIENDTVIQDLIDHPLLRSKNYDFIHTSSKDARGIDVALIYNKDHFKPLNYRACPVKMTVSDTTEKRFTRDVLYISGELDGELIHLSVNHWPSRSGSEKRSAINRNAAASVNRYLMDSLYNMDPASKFIVMGDLNDNPDDESLTKYLQAEKKEKNVEGSKMFNPMHKLYNKGLGSNAYRDSWSLFDQIVISAGLLNDDPGKLKYQKALILNKKFLLQKNGKYKGYPNRTFNFDVYQGGFSDHLPVYVYLTKTLLD